MSREIDFFDSVFDRPTQRSGGRGSKYPFDEWLDARRVKGIQLFRMGTDPDAPGQMDIGDFNPTSKNFMIQLQSKYDKIVGLDDTQVGEIQVALMDPEDEENSPIALRVRSYDAGTPEYQKITERREKRALAARERALKKQLEQDADDDVTVDDVDVEDIESAFEI